jgi:hypothetical protein
MCNAPNGSNMTLNLPSAATCPGRTYVVFKISNNPKSVVITPVTGEFIDGAINNSNITAQYMSLTVISNGVGWYIISSFP